MSGISARGSRACGCPATRSSAGWSAIAAAPRSRRRTPEVTSTAFVAEHARNAGPTLYLLQFGEPDPDRSSGTAPALTRRVADVRALRDGWLEEDRAVLVVR